MRVVEAAAYYFRSLSHDNVRKTLPFLLQNLLILSAPPFLAASVYMSLRRIARQLNREDLVHCPRLLTKIFILVDVVCFGTQVAGSIISGDPDPSKASQGKTTIVSGLVLQIVAFGLFIAWSAVFHGRLRSLQVDTLGQPISNWERYIYGIYAISCLFVVRNVTRLIEYSQGPSSPMLSSEAYLYLLDGSIMVVVVVLFLILHPGQLKRRARRAHFPPLAGSEAELVGLDRITDANTKTLIK